MGPSTASALKLPRLDLRQALQQAVHRHHHASAEKVGHAGPARLYRERGQVDAGLPLEKLHREVRRAAGTRRAVVDLAGTFFGERDEVLHAVRGQRRVGHEDEMHVDHLGNRREGPQRVDSHLRKEVLVRRHVAHRGHEERVAVGIGARRDLGADRAACAGTVLDHHRLAPEVGETRRKKTRHDVGAAARREGDDDPDGLVGKGVGHPDGQAEQQREYFFHRCEKSVIPLHDLDARDQAHRHRRGELAARELLLEGVQNAPPVRTNFCTRRPKPTSEV